MLCLWPAQRGSRKEKRVPPRGGTVKRFRKLLQFPQIDGSVVLTFFGKHPLSRIVLRGLWGIYVMTLFVMTHIPLPHDMTLLQNNFDKVIHAGAYLTLCLLTVMAFWNVWQSRLQGRWTLLAGLLLYAMADELLQIPVGRSGDVVDWLADATGILAGALLVVAFQWISSVSSVDESPQKS